MEISLDIFIIGKSYLLCICSVLSFVVGIIFPNGIRLKVLWNAYFNTLHTEIPLDVFSIGKFSLFYMFYCVYFSAMLFFLIISLFFVPRLFPFFPYTCSLFTSCFFRDFCSQYFIVTF